MDPEVTSPEQTTGEIDVDKLLSDIENPTAPDAPAPEPKEPAWNAQEWEFDWNGKKILPESRDKVRTWMSQGYNYSQRMGELNRTHAERVAQAEAKERAAKEIESKYKLYAEVDDYARQNQDWWNHVQQSFQTRQQPQLDPNLRQMIDPLKTELDEIKQFVNDQRQQAEQAKLQKEDEALDSEIEAIRKSHPTIDLNATDEMGETLERRILKHADEIGTKSFRAAFRDYLHDQLVVQSQAQSKLQAVRTTQAQTKAGLLGRTPGPTKELRAVDTRRPWNDPQFDVETILEELRQTGG